MGAAMTCGTRSPGADARRRRPVGAGLVLAGRAEPERHDVDEHEAGDDEPRASRATPWSDVAARTASETSGITTRVRSWAVSMKASPRPRRVAATSRGTSDSAAGRIAAMPIPWKTLAARKGPTEPPGSTPGSARITQPTMYASPPAVNARTPPTRSTTMPVRKAAGIWTRAAVPTISPICGSGTPACASATGSVAVNAWKPAWTAKTAKARRSIRASSRNGRRQKGRRPRRSGPVGGSAGRRGRLAPGGRDGP